MSIKAGMKVHCYGDVGVVVSIKSDKIAVVRFTGRTRDGKFGLLKGVATALISNLKPHKEPQ